MTVESLNIDGTMVPHTVIPIIGDGACLFRAISCLLYDTQVMAREVREQIVNHVVANWEEFVIMSHDSNEDNYSSAAEYSIDMSRPFTYGSLCELEAAGQLFSWVFKVYRNAVRHAAVLKYQKKNSEVHREAVARYQQTHPDREEMARYQQAHPEFIKELHVSFVKHLEELWHGLSAMIQHHWNTMLETIEPTFIHLIHYLETLSWKASKEILGKELQAIMLEIIEEFRELEKLPSIQFAIKKFNEVYVKFMWFYDYLDVGSRFQRAVTLIHSKLTDITQTALQAENRYREAKTKFIFDPENGHVELEQKLPMSWHTFNETPKFEEIPEYKYLASIQEYFDTSNTTFWSIYHDYNYYSESSNWLPPFKAQAVLAGPQHIITFDRKFIEYQGTCSYLLAADFVDHNFTLEVTFQKGISRLPLDFGDIYVYQETSMINIDSVRGFSLRCNLKFDTCTFTLSVVLASILPATPRVTPNRRRRQQPPSSRVELPTQLDLVPYLYPREPAHIPIPGDIPL
uniref:OTU domain-containing protein n=1 Tax=Timema tahoe TaxID=61484 RepID=A0A7R9NVN9_9NEOP|nr:unnamed protein product [Timema tahoe]